MPSYPIRLPLYQIPKLSYQVVDSVDFRTPGVAFPRFIVVLSIGDAKIQADGKHVLFVSDDLFTSIDDCVKRNLEVGDKNLSGYLRLLYVENGYDPKNRGIQC